MRILLGILFTICFCSMAFADTSYLCTRGGMERTIEVVYLGAGTVPCEVRYTKDGTTEVLWSARFEAGYCDEKAADFVEKQQQWGWDCVVNTAELSEPVVPDGPEALESDGLGESSAE